MNCVKKNACFLLTPPLDNIHIHMHTCIVCICLTRSCCRSFAETANPCQDCRTNTYIYIYIYVRTHYIEILARGIPWRRECLRIPVPYIDRERHNKQHIQQQQQQQLLLLLLLLYTTYLPTYLYAYRCLRNKHSFCLESRCLRSISEIS